MARLLGGDSVSAMASAGGAERLQAVLIACTHPRQGPELPAQDSTFVDTRRRKKNGQASAQ